MATTAYVPKTFVATFTTNNGDQVPTDAYPGYVRVFFQDTAPSTSLALEEGDLWYKQSTRELYVWNSVNSAWEWPRTDAGGTFQAQIDNLAATLSSAQGSISDLDDRLTTDETQITSISSRTDTVSARAEQVLALAAADATAKASGKMSKGELVINVRDYGATGNGTTDDTAAIQSAITAASSGGVVYFPSGTFKVVGTVSVAKPLTLTGPGVLYKSSTGSALLDVSSSDVTLRGLTLQNIGTSGTAVDGTYAVYVHGPTYSSPLSDIVIENCRIIDWAHSGIWAVNVTRMLVRGNRIRNLMYAGVMLLSATDSSVTHNRVSDLVQKTPVVNTYGIAVSDVENTDAGRSRNVIIANNIVKNVTQWEGIDTHGGVGILVIGNTVVGCYDGIAMVSGNAERITAPRNVVVTGNIIDPTGAVSPRSAIRLFGNSTELASGLIADNRILPGYSSDLGGGNLDVDNISSDLWISITPSLYGITLGNGTVSCRYVKIGRNVTMKFNVTFGSTTTLSGVLGFYAPLAMSANIGLYDAIGAATLIDTSAGGTGRYAGVAARLSTADSRVFFITGNSTVQPTVPTTVTGGWASGDSFSCTITYETAT